MTPASPHFANGLKDVVLRQGVAIIRIHHKDNGPVWFGPKPGDPPAYRFDAPGGEYRTMYAADKIEGAFAETILRKPRGRILRRAYVDDRAWSVLTIGRDLKLAKLYDEGLLWHGIDSNIGSSDSYTEPRRIALELHADFPDLDGIAYRARHNDGQICYAIFDRIDPTHFKTMVTTLFKNKPTEVDDLMALYGAHFDPTPPLPSP
ncbi:RES family NAD+ phosphorylase [Telmatospirillum sp.]|uniref:RES family NAD+ phosphorylase n=1 Tax=Telmatospirillum sp. TaxID=2079197 RepID=UPI0028524332|nr:RES family NAD+ phosphorylase [Telmatospirillum sp.]MDR3439735.1 RES family NAD+ phosphorylase [Telmatospirillum sp.]